MTPQYTEIRTRLQTRRRDGDRVHLDVTVETSSQPWVFAEHSGLINEFGFFPNCDKVFAAAEYADLISASAEWPARRALAEDPVTDDAIVGGCSHAFMRDCWRGRC